MESNRARYSIKKLSISQEGASLFAAILIALFALLALGGLYFALTKLLGTSHTIKTYASVKDAAVGGVNHAVMLLQSEEITNDQYCPPNNPLNLRFRIAGRDGTFENRINICFMTYTIPPGFETLGVAYTKELPGEKGNIYTIISEAEGPEDTRSRIEAVYAR
ncbi:hypothetical protein QI155_01120 [Thermodesulfovibrio sp. 1176]|uniref:hypothetical protein n=1 Tax=Thermodesulfovibrio sp. 1176 TaxID=3043424 RepID=UPI0024830574|nr:hypothetical protein [Thermodesulfovibrio sp. 1176]MDI1471135.1 hypothetical protein [Thermodesulfovibrio sp. 1176]